MNVYRRLFLTLPLLAVSLPAPLAAEPTVRRAEPAAAGGGTDSTPHSAREQRILKMLSSMEIPQLEELLEGYARLNNRRMAEPLIREIMRRDPRNERAAELYSSLSDASAAPDDPG